MKEFSINNGVSYSDTSDFTMKECIFIQDKWEVIINSMDKETMEKVNDFTDADTKTLEGKIQYIIDYLDMDKFDIVIG